MAGPLRRGGGQRAGPLRKKRTYFGTIFSNVRNFSCQVEVRGGEGVRP